jgi:hypothetical protein
VPSITSPTGLLARVSAATLAAMTSESARQNVILMNGYFFWNASVTGRSA